MIIKPATAWLLMGVGVTLASGAALWRVQCEDRADRSDAALTALRLQLPATTPTEPHPEVPRDFVPRLPHAPSLDPVVRDLQRLCGEVGTIFVSIDATPREATPRTVARKEAVVVLRGPYAALKSVLAQVLDRHANVLVQRLSIRRLHGTGDGVEAQVALMQLGRPHVADVGTR